MSRIDLDKLPKSANADGGSSGNVKGGGKISQIVKIVSAVVMLAYIVLPTDLIPDFAPVIGWVDDLAAGIGMIATVVSAIKNRRYDPNSRMEQRAKDIFGDDNY